MLSESLDSLDLQLEPVGSAAIYLQKVQDNVYGVSECIIKDMPIFHEMNDIITCILYRN